MSEGQEHIAHAVLDPSLLSFSESIDAPAGDSEPVDRAVLEPQHNHQENRSRYWVLKKGGQVDDIVSSCETSEKNVIIADRTGVRVERAYAIVDVYTAPFYRRQGLAALLMENIKHWLDSEGQAAVSILFSAIGKEYYAKFGWLPVTAQQLVLHPMESAIAEEASGVKPLLENDLRTLCDQDIEATKNFMQSSALPDEVHLAILPSFVQLAWRFSQEEVQGRRLHNRTPLIKGVISTSGRSWLIWQHSFRSSTLRIRRAVLLSRQDFQQNVQEMASLLQQAVAHSQEWKLQKTVLWNPGAEVIAASELLKYKFESKIDIVIEEMDNDSVPSLRWRNDHYGNGIAWESKEFYTWK